MPRGPTAKYADCSACTAVGLLFGSQWHIAEMSSTASLEALGRIFLRLVGAKRGNLKPMACASFKPSGQVCKQITGCDGCAGL